MRNAKIGWALFVSAALGAVPAAWAQSAATPPPHSAIRGNTAHGSTMHGSTMSGSVIGGSGHGLTVEGGSTPGVPSPGVKPVIRTHQRTSIHAGPPHRARTPRAIANPATSRRLVTRRVPAAASPRVRQQGTPAGMTRPQGHKLTIAPQNYGSNGRRGIRLAPAGAPAMETGRVAGLNLKSKTFTVVAGTHTTPVSAANATITIHNRRANIYRLMGSPQIEVRGRTLRSGLVQASSIKILDNGVPTLQTSHYTRSARPPLYTGRGASRRRR